MELDSLSGVFISSSAVCDDSEVKNVLTWSLLPHFHDTYNSYKDKIPWLLGV